MGKRSRDSTRRVPAEFATVVSGISFTTYEGALGADTRAQLHVNYAEYLKAVTVNRPRTIGVRMSYKFSGG
jgi:hypothetical protein